MFYILSVSGAYVTNKYIDTELTTEFIFITAAVFCLRAWHDKHTAFLLVFGVLKTKLNYVFFNSAHLT